MYTRFPYMDRHRRSLHAQMDRRLAEYACPSPQLRCVLQYHGACSSFIILIAPSWLHLPPATPPKGKITLYYLATIKSRLKLRISLLLNEKNRKKYWTRRSRNLPHCIYTFDTSDSTGSWVRAKPCTADTSHTRTSLSSRDAHRVGLEGTTTLASCGVEQGARGKPPINVTISPPCRRDGVCLHAFGGGERRFWFCLAGRTFSTKSQSYQTWSRSALTSLTIPKLPGCIMSKEGAPAGTVAQDSIRGGSSVNLPFIKYSYLERGALLRCYVSLSRASMRQKKTEIKPPVHENCSSKHKTARFNSTDRAHD